MVVNTQNSEHIVKKVCVETYLCSGMRQKRGWDENGIPPAEVEKKFSD